MDKVRTYQKILLEFLEEYVAFYGQNDLIETQILADNERHHYQLQRVGWNGEKYLHYCVFHFDIKNEKIWIQENRTDTDIAEELVQKGIPKSDIVLGLQPPYARAYTGYAVA